MALQKRGVRPFEAINHLVDKYHLVRLDPSPFTPSSLYLRSFEELAAVDEIGQQP